VDWLGGDRVDDGLDLRKRTKPRRIETIGARVRVRAQTADRLGEVRPAHQKAFRASGEYDVGAARIDRAPRGANALDRERELEEGALGIARRVFDGEAGDTGLRGGSDVSADGVRLDRETALEVGIHGHAHALAHEPQ